MKKLKLSELHLFRLQSARNGAAAVLHQIKLHQLEGEALRDMKTLESAVQAFDCFLLGK
jgi:hypothetical protein